MRKIEQVIGCNSWGDAELLHKFIQKHGKPFIESKICKDHIWQVVLWRVYGCSDIEEYYEFDYDSSKQSTKGENNITET